VFKERSGTVILSGRRVECVLCQSVDAAAVQVNIKIDA
jgi:uncharacterized Fe-S radical SAM superfamily protein PflX